MPVANASSLKQRIRAGEPTIGSWMNLGSPAVVEIMADAGFDWLVIDLEHTVTTIREAAEMIRIADLKGVPPLVRLGGHDWTEAKRVLDAGAHGVIVPMVSTAAQAKAAVGAVRYPPVGVRGVGLSRAQGYGAGFEHYLRDVEPNTIVIAQIEHADAIANLDEILSVDEIDATMIGPYDLSGSVGKPGKFDDPQVADLLRRYKDVSKRKGKGMGYHVVQPDAAVAREKLAEGYILLALSVDFLYLANGCRTALSELRKDR